MGMVSAAEAALESQVRPEIMLVRARTSYPRRPVRLRTSASAAGNGAGRAMPDTARSQDAAAQPHAMSALRPVPALGADPVAGVTPQSAGRVSLVTAHARGKSAADEDAMVSRPTSHVPRPRTRLTRRGKVVVGALAAVTVILAAILVWIAAAARAQAASQVSAGSPGRLGMARVVARPGQSLWEIAVQVDPSADPRIVIRQIMTDNDLSVPSIRAGQVLWVPQS